MSDDIWPPRCSDCGKFIPFEKSIIERRSYGPPSYGPDDIQVAVCDKCAALAKARGDAE